MLVDPQVLRSFAAQVDIATSAMSGIDLERNASTAADGLPGSETQWMTRQVGDHVSLAAKDIIDDVGFMGRLVRGAGDRYEVDDTALAGDFKTLF